MLTRALIAIAGTFLAVLGSAVSIYTLSIIAILQLCLLDVLTKIYPIAPQLLDSHC